LDSEIGRAARTVKTIGSAARAKSSNLSKRLGTKIERATIGMIVTERR
jgi:hypothetical protein